MQRVDWFRLIDDLKRAGKSLYDAGEATGIPTSTIYGYKEGAEPKHSDGEVLIGYWLRVTGMHRADVPITTAGPISASRCNRTSRKLRKKPNESPLK